MMWIRRGPAANRLRQRLQQDAVSEIGVLCSAGTRGAINAHEKLAAGHSGLNALLMHHLQLSSTTGAAVCPVTFEDHHFVQTIDESRVSQGGTAGKEYGRPSSSPFFLNRNMHREAYRALLARRHRRGKPTHGPTSKYFVEDARIAPGRPFDFIVSDETQASPCRWCCPGTTEDASLRCLEVSRRRPDQFRDPRLRAGRRSRS